MPRSADILPFPVDHADPQRYRLDTHRVVDAGPLACNLYESLAEDARRTELLRQIRREEIDHDLRVIGWGMAAAYFAVCIFRLSQMGVL